MKYFLIIVAFFQLGLASRAQNIHQNDSEHFSFDVITHVQTLDDLQYQSFLIGLPNKSFPQASVQYLEPTDCPFDCSSLQSVPEFWAQQQIVQSLETATFVVSPVKGNNQYYKRIQIQFDFDHVQNQFRPPTQNQIRLLSSQIMNWDYAQNWIKPKATKRMKSSSHPAGTWLSFKIEKDGMAKLSYNTISSVYSQLSSVDPRSFMLFTGPDLGRSKTQATNQSIQENLVEIGISISGENDGSFDSGDEIIFYSNGPSGYNVSSGTVIFKQNLYFTQNTYYLLIPNDNSQRGQRVADVAIPENITLSIDYGLCYVHQEIDMINPAHSGLGWASSPISHNGTYSLNINIPTPETTIDAGITMGFLGGELTPPSYHNTNHKIYCYYKTVEIGLHRAYASWSSIGSHAANFIISGSELSNGSNLFYAVNSSSNSNSQPYFDFINLQYGRHLSVNDSYDFYSPVLGTKVRFVLDDAPSSSTHVWDISDAINPKSMILEGNSDLTTFDTQTLFASPSHFVVFQSDELDTVSTITNEGLMTFHGLRTNNVTADHVIIGPESYRESAQPLLELRYPAMYASIEDIYTEFSAGNQDPMAIRAFIQWTQEHWGSPTPYTVFLIGDADYDYRNISGESGNIIPTIEVGTSFSWATDDRLATLYGSIPEIALGRFPARNKSEFEDYIDKLIDAESSPELGPWRQRVTLIADDGARPEKDAWEIGTGKSHTNNSEDLASIIPPTIEINKLYMLEFPEESDASVYGVVKPEATQAVINALNEGTAIINYIGHGSSTQLAQERLLYLDRGDIQLMNTGNKYPVWIVGTCSFGHFDDLHIESFSEELIRTPMNAAVAVISTTRKITVSGNANYSEDLFSTIFPEGGVTTLPIGSILRNIKTGYGEGEYFTLFGDPAMKLPIPSDTLTISSISPDTIETLALGSFIGQQSAIDKSGTGIVALRDAKRMVTREYNIASTTQSVSYSLPGPLLFRGQFSFSGNQLNGDFRIPLDISYSNENAEMNIYIYENDGNGEALGNKNNIPLRGGNSTSDAQGPIISFEAHDGRIISTGDHVDKENPIVIRLSDAMGINLTNEIGHEIMLTDLQSQSSENITNDFIYDINSITTGTIPYQVSSNESTVKFTIKAWDSANNPSEKTLSLNISELQSLGLYNIFNYPNPFSNETQFTFELNLTADITLAIFTLGGRKIMEFIPTEYTSGYHTIDWNGNDAFGGQLANGVYLYRIQAEANGKKVSSIGRIAKFR